MTRLLQWAEQQLCSRLSCETACSLLALSQLYSTQVLEEHSLAFIKANIADGEPTDHLRESSRYKYKYQEGTPTDRRAPPTLLLPPLVLEV